MKAKNQQALICDGQSCCHGVEECGASNADALRCTLPKGHSGNHIACSCHEHNLDTWENIGPISSHPVL